MARTALLIAAKDVRQRLRDRSALLVAIVVPLVLASIFGLIFHDVTSGRVAFTVAFVDQDRGEAARALRDRALLPLSREGLIELRSETTVAAARDAADTGKVAAAIVVPAGFTAAVHAGRPLRIDVVGDVDSPIGTQVAESIVQSFAGRIQTARVARAAVGPSAPGVERIGAGPIEVQDISTTSRQLDVGTFYAAGMAVFFLFFTVQFGVSSIIDERRDGTLARMLVAPIRRGAVLAGKLLTSVVLGVTSMVVLAVTTAVLLDAHWGDPLGVALLIGAGVLAATAVMALVATFAKTPDQAQAWQSMVALVLGTLGGTFFPIAQAGGALAALSLLTPQAWFLRGIENLAGEEGASAVAGPVLAMLAFAAVVGAFAYARAGRLIAR